jgi:phytoene dehydrogenase-like protein
MIEGFFRPFLGGIFLDRDLATSSRMRDFVMRMFSLGDAALPGRGMGAIPAQIAAGLPEDAVRLGARVEALIDGGVRLEGGEILPAGAVVVATQEREAARLLGGPAAAATTGTTCYYFDAPEPPLRQPILALDGEGSGPVNNVCVPSQVVPGYAPAGRSLISASVVGTVGHVPSPPVEAILDQLRGWFGPQVDAWRHLRTYHLPEALPARTPAEFECIERPVRVSPGRFVCGDHRRNGSLQGAMESGRHAADAVIEELG